MFGRNRNDDYEDYNRSQNAKYDDDYIRDTEEYRGECTHSHEQAYENYDVREECRHDHEQTYENFNSEQRPYDEMNELEKFFVSLLEDGEYFLWCGKPVKGANFSETGMGGMSGAGCMMYVIALAFLTLNPIITVILIIAASFMRNVSNLKGHRYAVTNRRVIICGGAKPCMIPLDMIGAVTFHSSPRNIGYVTFAVKPEYSKRFPRRAPITSNAFFAVNDSEKVAEILKQAKQNYSN